MRGKTPNRPKERARSIASYAGVFVFFKLLQSTNDEHHAGSRTLLMKIILFSTEDVLPIGLGAQTNNFTEYLVRALHQRGNFMVAFF